MQKRFFIRSVKQIIPIVDWLPKYNAENAVGDIIAGITVGLTLIPQSIAYAALAGLEPQYGLYSSLVGGFIYACFGTVKDLNIAPTALISLLTYSYTKDLENPHAAIFLCFCVGTLQFLFGLFKLGFLVDFVSASVVSGFTSAGALTIAASQVKSMLGLKFRAESFIEVVYHVFVNISSTKLSDAVLSLLCCCFLLALREIKKYGASPSAENSTKFKTSIWFLSVGRNAIIVLATSVTAYFLPKDTITLTNTVPDGLPQFGLPFSTDSDFISELSTLANGIVIVSLVAILSNMAIAKAFSTGKVMNASHEMSTLGLCNVVGSFFGSYPVNASFSRAALNNASGARTTFGGMYTGVMVILSLTFLTKYFVFIPKASLASVIFCAVIYIVEVDTFKAIWNASKLDSIPLLVTFFWSLGDSIERGILIGVLVDLLLVIWWSSRPTIQEDILVKSPITCIQIPLVGSLAYMSGEFMRERIRKIIKQTRKNKRKPNSENQDKLLLIFDCDKLQRIDYSATKALSLMLNDLECEKVQNSNESYVTVRFLNLNEELRDKIERVNKIRIICINKRELDELTERCKNDITSINNPVNNCHDIFITTPC